MSYYVISMVLVVFGDLICTGVSSKIHQSYTFLLQLLQELRLGISDEKLVPPSTSVVYLINTGTRAISIPEKKFEEIKQLYYYWKNINFCTKTQLQSLLGSLLYITKCIRPASFFFK